MDTAEWKVMVSSVDDFFVVMANKLLLKTTAIHVNYMVDKVSFCLISGNGEDNSGSDMETEQGKVNQEWLCASNFVYNFYTPTHTHTPPPRKKSLEGRVYRDQPIAKF